MHEKTSYTYLELENRVEQIAAGQLSLGLERHDRVGIFAPNLIDWYCVQLATSLCDLILVNINPNYQVKELEFALNKVQCTALVMTDSLKTSSYTEMLEKIAPEIVSLKTGQILNSKHLPHLKHIIKIDNTAKPNSGCYINLEEIIQKGKNPQNLELVKIAEPKIQPEDPTNIQFTSGTTGFPKASTQSHFNILNNGRIAGEGCGYTDKDIVCVSVPLYHCFGMVLANLAVLFHGGSLVYPCPTFKPEDCQKAITSYKCTSLYGVPTMFLNMIKAYEQNPKIYNLETLRTGIVAGSQCPPTLMKKMRGAPLNIPEITNCYGQTEISPISHQTPRDCSLEHLFTSVGKTVNNVESKIIDKKGRLVPIGEIGELCSRGFGTMIGYWGDEEKTNQLITRQGWVHSGDLAVMDSEGYTSIIGRSKDMIIRGGENVYPKEIEEHLLTHDNIEDVQVFGVDSEVYGEEIFAWIKLKDESKTSRKDIYDFCHKQIAHFKVPKYVDFIRDFPITVTGKYQKYKMTEQVKNQAAKNPELWETWKIR